ncbi:uncharacterized protein [Watersipora subatra]|uniref:uncharacterized protein isoform X2 n=1 Tax=Watersipora subatra TaxID=2589382 RepID=UPI00355BDCA5
MTDTSVHMVPHTPLLQSLLLTPGGFYSPDSSQILHSSIRSPNDSPFIRRVPLSRRTPARYSFQESPRHNLHLLLNRPALSCNSSPLYNISILPSRANSMSSNCNNAEITEQEQGLTVDSHNSSECQVVPKSRVSHCLSDSGHSDNALNETSPQQQAKDGDEEIFQDSPDDDGIFSEDEKDEAEEIFS